MKRACTSGLFSAKRVLLGDEEDRTVPDVDPGGSSVVEPDVKRVKYGDLVDRCTLKKAGNYIIGPLIGSSPIECLQQRLARKSGTNEFYILKILTIDDNPKTEKESRDMMQGKVLLHTENTLLQLLKDTEGVIHSHEFFTDWTFEEKLTERVERNPVIQIYTGRILKRIILVLDCIYPHEFDVKSTAYINLHQYVQKAKLAERDILGIFKKVVEIVEKLHDKNIIHRDLKLNNVVLNRVSSKVYITNFCLGRLLTSESALFYDQRGSPAYISPEILSGKPYKGKPCDMWSLGVMLYTMVVGRFPFVDSTPPALFKKIKHADFSFPLEKKISSETRGLIKSLLCLRPEDRYTASETLTMLDMIIQKQIKNKRSVDQTVPDVDDMNHKPSSKIGPSVELCSEQFSELLSSQTRESKSFIRPNILSVQRYRTNPLMAIDTQTLTSAPSYRRTSLTHQINNLSLRAARLIDPSSWHARLNTGSGTSPSYTPTSPNSPTQQQSLFSVPSTIGPEVSSLFAALNDLFTRGVMPVPRQPREFNGFITHDIASKISTFLRVNCRNQAIVRELFFDISIERPKVIELFRRCGVQMEMIDHTVSIKPEQTNNNLMFLTFMMQIAGYNNNYFLNIRN